MKAGDPVRVSQSVVVFHHPQHRGEAFDLLGQQGEVVTVLEDWKGRVISPTLPVVVAFGKFRAHFRADEIESL
ncbi:MAG: ferredoxin-thioredoxin reductase variable chain [Cyanobacteriota bacterium]|nr:ferredoxin-thioredoxin reductase variable chain [Cyanobacteriota bacterium]